MGILESASSERRAGRWIALGIFGVTAGAAAVADPPATSAGSVGIGRIAIATVPFDATVDVRSATYTPSGKVLVAYADKGSTDPWQVDLATMDDDGRNVRRFFSERLVPSEKANGIRYMIFPDNRRIFFGDYILECTSSLETCDTPRVFPVAYPSEIAGGSRIADRWSEVVVAPDGRHVAWTTLLANYSAVVFVGTIERTASGYRIVQPHIVSTLDPFRADPAHPDGRLPVPLLGGEVKQFVHGGAGLSLVGAARRDTPDSVVQDLHTGRKEAITDSAGYTETTIFSPDERLGITMTTRFSPRSDLAILGLMPRPYPDSLNMGLSMFAYTYSVTGVRSARAGNVGPALIDIAKSTSTAGYRGVDLNTDDDWVFRSPMSWHPGGMRAMWIEGRRGTSDVRIRIVRLRDYRPGPVLPAASTPEDIASSSTDLSQIARHAGGGQAVDVKVYGRSAGYIRYTRSPQGLIEKRYVGYSDDGKSVYAGSETLQANPGGRSTYTAKVTLSGPKPGKMDLRMTFGPLRGPLPAQLIFDVDGTDAPATSGYAEYDGRRLLAKDLEP